jgi:hypothetical protein
MRCLIQKDLFGNDIQLYHKFKKVLLKDYETNDIYYCDKKFCIHSKNNIDEFGNKVVCVLICKICGKMQS